MNSDRKYDTVNVNPLRCEFLGMTLKTPIVMAASPITASAERICQAAEAGAGAVVLKSVLANSRKGSQTGAARRIYLSEEHGTYMLSSPQRELLDADEAVKLCRDASRIPDLPVIASIAPSDFKPEPFIRISEAMIQAGASAIQIDGYYLPKPWCLPGNYDAFMRFLEKTWNSIVAPIVIKLNPDVPMSWIETTAMNWPVNGWSLLDSARVATPVMLPDIDLPYPGTRKAGMCSIAGPWLKPLSLEYTRILHHLSGKEILAGGGVMNGTDVLEFMIRGGSAVQTASAVLRHGFSWITASLEEITGLLCGRTLADYICRARAVIRQKENYFCSETEKSEPVLNSDQCSGCGKCVSQTMCEAVRLSENGIPAFDRARCDGCGFCARLCPNHAIGFRTISDSSKPFKGSGKGVSL